MTSSDQHENDGRGEAGLVRRVLNPGPSPEERLEELLAAAPHASSTRTPHASASRSPSSSAARSCFATRVPRSSECCGSGRRTSRRAKRSSPTSSADLTDREAALSAAEEDLARRRQELGAVELKRAAVERRERALEAREADLEQLETELEERRPRSTPASAAGRGRVELVFVPGERLPARRARAGPAHSRTTRSTSRARDVRRRADRAVAPSRRRATVRLPRARHARRAPGRRQLVDARTRPRLVPLADELSSRRSACATRNCATATSSSPNRRSRIS